MTAPGGGWASIPAMTAAAAERYGDQPAVVDGAVRLTYAELFEQARTFAAALVASGVQAGDRVSIWAPNGAEWIVAVLGLFQAGAVLVPINTRFKGAEGAELLVRSHAKVLVTVTDFLDTDYLAMLEATGTDLPDLETVVVARGDAPADTVGWAAFLERATDDTRATVDERRAALGPDDPSDILFTSGTTGVPKGVVMTHGRTLGVATDWVAMTGLGPDDRYLMVNPYFHMFGLKAGILACVAGGATMLPEPVFDVDRVLARVAAEQVTVLPGAPTIYQAILDHPGRDDHDLSTLRIAVTGAADIPVELIRRVDAELPFSSIVIGLRPHRGRHRQRHGPRRRRRDRGHHGRSPATGLRTPHHRRPGPGRPPRRAGRDRAPRPHGDGGLPRRSGGDRPRALPRRVAADR